MKLVPVAQSCHAGSCPTIFTADDGQVVVQGYVVPAQRAGATGATVPDGEALVRVPRELIMEAARQLGEA